MVVEVALYSQHVPGCHNVVVDSLSRDHHIESKKLAFLLKQLYPSQAQENLFILEQIPKEISSWIESLKPSATNRMALPSKPTRSKMGTFVNSNCAWKEVVSMTTSWMDTIKQKKILLMSGYAATLR